MARELNAGPAVQRLAALGLKPATDATGRSDLPAPLRKGIEALSGISMDGVRVHRNSPLPATMQAYAFARGRDIHLGPGQEHHLPHEAWHVVQQAQGRVSPTTQLSAGVAINDDAHLEREADLMGARASGSGGSAPLAGALAPLHVGTAPAAQRRAGIEFETSVEARVTASYQPNQAPLSGWVAQDETMAQSNGWQIDSDNSKLEFVTHPPVNLAALPAVATDMLNHVSALPASLNAGADLGTLLNIATTKPYTVLPYANRRITGAPQGTVGIPFDRLFSFFDLLTHYQMAMGDLQVAQNKDELQQAWRRWKGLPERNEAERAQKAARKERRIQFGRNLKADQRHHGAISANTARTFRGVAAAVNQATAGLGNVAPAELAKLKGLLHFLGQYATFGSTENQGYEKKRFPVMARSSFHSMYAALGQEAKNAFPDAATAVVQHLGFTVDTTLLPGRPGVSFNVGGWLDSIQNPTDVTIPEPQPRVVQSDWMTAPGSVQYEGGPVAMNTDKSMGSLGLDNGLVVVELRQFRLRSTGNSFSIAAARQLVNDLAALVARA